MITARVQDGLCHLLLRFQSILLRLRPKTTYSTGWCLLNLPKLLIGSIHGQTGDHLASHLTDNLQIGSVSVAGSE